MALRRGLRRTGGFGLFIAVCNAPSRIDELIRELEASMPETQIETVRLDARTEFPLWDVLDQVRPDGTGPVMILDLEASTRSPGVHPVLGRLNMSREQWPEKLPRPVVFWVSDRLLGLLQFEAPDFTDWRSGTYFFAGSEPEPWVADRVRELRARLESVEETQDRVVLGIKAIWLRELGDHLDALSEADEAQSARQQALELERAREGRTQAENPP